MTKSIEQILQIQDDKGRMSIPPNVRKILDLKPESIIEITYLKLENEKTKELLPYSEQNTLDKTYRFQTTKTTRNYLEFKSKDYIYTKITKIK